MYELVLKVSFFTTLLLSSILTDTLFETLSFGLLEHKSLGDMFIELLFIQQDWLHPGILVIFGVTFVVGMFISILSQGYRIQIYVHLKKIALILSLLSWLIFLIPNNSESSVLGRLMHADLALMILLQCYLLAIDFLPIEAIVVGPLGACALAPSQLKMNPGSISRSIFFILALFPAIYRENGNVQSFQEIFISSNPIEIYSWVQVVFTCIYLILRHVPEFKTFDSWMMIFIKFAKLLAFVACANHNVAAAWALTI